MSITQGFCEKCPNISLDIDISQLRDMKDYSYLLLYLLKLKF